MASASDEISKAFAASEETFRPYALEIGFFIQEWNNLHDTLSSLFCEISGSKRLGPVWYAVPVDRFQRAMLKAAAFEFLPAKSELLEEVIWLISQIDKFGQQRDNVVHAPLTMILSEHLPGICGLPAPSTQQIALHPYLFIPSCWGNLRAESLNKGLGGQPLLEELKRYRAKASILKDYTLLLFLYMRDSRLKRPNATLPKRPSLPTSRQKKKDEEASRTSHAKRRQPPPQS